MLYVLLNTNNSSTTQIRRHRDVGYLMQATLIISAVTQKYPENVVSVVHELFFS